MCWEIRPCEYFASCMQCYSSRCRIVISDSLCTIYTSREIYHWTDALWTRPHTQYATGIHRKTDYQPRQSQAISWQTNSHLFILELQSQAWSTTLAQASGVNNHHTREWERPSTKTALGSGQQDSWMTTHQCVPGCEWYRIHNALDSPIRRTSEDTLGSPLQVDGIAMHRQKYVYLYPAPCIPHSSTITHLHTRPMRAILKMGFNFKCGRCFQQA